MTENRYTRESIIQRLYNNASKFWNIKSIDELDPVVRLLIEGLASDLYTAYQNIEDSNIRILESIAFALTPDALIATRPPHAIMQAVPIEPFLHIDKYTLFNDKQPDQELLKQGIREIPFSPVSTVRLVSGQVRYLVCERMLFSMTEGREKVLLTNAHAPDERINQTAWIGIDLHHEVNSLKQISFYLDFPHAGNLYEKYSLLPYTQWSMDEMPVETVPGLPSLEESETSFFAKYDLLNRIDSDILALYRLQFVTINQDVRLQEKQKKIFPEEIKNMFPEHITDTLEACYWLKITFPPHISALNIQDLTVHLNAFPVTNKIPHSVTSPPNSPIRIISLRSGEGEFFLSVDNVTDSHGYVYHSVPYETGLGEKSGVYTLKEGGLERFDGRTLKDYLDRLIDLLHSEASVFTAMNMDNVRGVINNLQKSITDVETKFRNSKMTLLEKPRYLMLNTLKPNDLVFIRYWTTHCELANDIRSGKRFTAESSIPVISDSCRLLKMSSGGRSAPSVTGRLNAYRYALTTHDQVFTHEDITNFCLYELGEKVIKVEVQRGIAVSPKPKEGLIRTIDIVLTPSLGCEKIVASMEMELLMRLHQKSPDSFNYRIILKNNEYK